MSSIHFSSKTDLWSTPQDFYDMVNNEFNFTCDVCSTHDNAKCKNHYTQEDDALTQEWGGVCWMNPPYGREIGKWMRKAHDEAQKGATIVCLVPSRTDTNWWHEHVIMHEVRFIRGRLRFGDAKNSAPFPSALVIMRSGDASKAYWKAKEYLLGSADYVQR